MLTKLRVRFDGKTFVPEQPVDFVADRLFEIELRPLEEASSTRPPAQKPTAEAESRSMEPSDENMEPMTFLQRLAAAAREFENDPVHLPSDFSIQHDHYLYGTPKKIEP